MHGLELFGVKNRVGERIGEVFYRCLGIMKERSIVGMLKGECMRSRTMGLIH